LQAVNKINGVKRNLFKIVRKLKPVMGVFLRMVKINSKFRFTVHYIKHVALHKFPMFIIITAEYFRRFRETNVACGKFNGSRDYVAIAGKGKFVVKEKIIVFYIGINQPH